MAEETTNVVKTTSDGMVKLSLEKYEELLKQAAEKPPVVQEVIRNVQKVIKTPEVAASDNKIWGLSLWAVGCVIAGVGGWRYLVGVKQAKELAKAVIDG